MVSTAQQMQRRKLAVRKRKRDAYNLKKKQAHYISMEGSKDEGSHDISAMISESVKKHRDSDNKRTYYVQATKKAKSNSHDELTSEDSCATSNPCGNSVESCSANFNATGCVQNAKISATK